MQWWTVFAASLKMLLPHARHEHDAAMSKSWPRVLSIAGSDSGGGAGLQAATRTSSNRGGHAMTAITGITVQNSVGVTAAELMTPELVLAQIKAVVDDFGVDAIKIGMLGSPEIALAV